MPEKAYYIQMFSIHGLLRASNMELGRDSDTGGQINYVVELARSLSLREDVAGVDLFTRLIRDKVVSQDYAQPLEQVNDKFRIVRIQCGGRKYLRKELLWPHLDEYVDKVIKFNKRQRITPDVVHGHYADAGYVARQLARIFGIAFVFTGHSLGRSKQEKLLQDGLTRKEIITKYKIDQRIRVEEEVISDAHLIVTSTRQEIDKQYGLYKARNAHCVVIPPGLDIEKFYPYYHDLLPETSRDEMQLYAQASLLQELNRFFTKPDKPLILSLCRPDKRKNITGLISAYGEDLELQSMANLAVFAGIRKDISQMEDNERDVLTRILLLMDKYDLYGRIAIPKKHDFELEVPELYRIAGIQGGVFVNPALTEPFGLTVIEAAATGLPVVAPQDGGPSDIIANCDCGILVDTTKPPEISQAIKSILSDTARWKAFSQNGVIKVREHYTWEAHGKTYLQQLARLPHQDSRTDVTVTPAGRRLTQLQYFLVTDIDNTLIGPTNDDLPELIQVLREHREVIGFGVATGRTLDSAREILKAHAIPAPDVMITSVGAEIYYGSDRLFSKGWETHIAHKWDRKRIEACLKSFDFLTPQEDATQRPFKLSYFMAPGRDRLPAIQAHLQKHRCPCTLIYSHEEFLDILPQRASKGKALRYLSYKWEIPLGNFLVCGDSGNDQEMLRGDPMAVVVANYSPEMEALKGARKVWFARKPSAGGILEGLAKYDFLKRARAQ